MSEPEKKNSFSAAYAAYSTLVIQMGIMITAGAYFGQWLDGYFSMGSPIFTMLASLLAVFGSLYWMFKRTTNTKDGD